MTSVDCFGRHTEYSSGLHLGEVVVKEQIDYIFFLLGQILDRLMKFNPPSGCLDGVIGDLAGPMAIGLLFNINIVVVLQTSLWFFSHVQEDPAHATSGQAKEVKNLRDLDFIEGLEQTERGLAADVGSILMLTNNRVIAKDFTGKTMQFRGGATEEFPTGFDTAVVGPI